MSNIESLKARVMYRVALEDGELLMPNIIDEPTELMMSMWNSLWVNYLRNKSSISTPYWFDKFQNPAEFNQFLKKLSDDGWITSTVVPSRHWAEISLNESKLLTMVDAEDLIRVRTERKFNKYKLGNSSSNKSNLTRLNGTLTKTGLKRSGFAKAGQSRFKYDTDMMLKYREAIVLNTTKSIRKIEKKHHLVIDGADYKSISEELIDYHLYSPDSEFKLGVNFNDSRGRAISSALAKVFNPIGFKDARALLITPERVIPNDRKIIRQFTQAIYLFIAELNGIRRCKSKLEKAKIGRHQFKQRMFPTVDLSTEKGRKDLNEIIWLERIYNRLEQFLSRDISRDFTWNIPIELDASASLLQIQGGLLNHSPYLSITNCIGTTIEDPWYHKDLTRHHVKSYCTPSLYGSSQTVQYFWDKNGLEYTPLQLAIMSVEQKSGLYSIANDFKNMTIEHVNPREDMTINIDGEVFDIKCNKFRNVGDYTRRYPIYDTKSGMVLAIAHTHTHKVPDLKRFKLYFQTLLVHNLDSQIANSISLELEWVLSIHDAFIVHPLDAHLTRHLYARKIEGIWERREAILNGYFKSIGLGNSAMKEWIAITDKCDNLSTFKCNDMALK